MDQTIRIVLIIVILAIVATPFGLLLFTSYRKKIRIKKEYFDKQSGQVLFAQQYSAKRVMADFSGEFLTIVYPKSSDLGQAVEFFKKNREGIIAEWDRRRETNESRRSKHPVIWFIFGAILLCILLWLIFGNKNQSVICSQDGIYGSTSATCTMGY